MRELVDDLRDRLPPVRHGRPGRAPRKPNAPGEALVRRLAEHFRTHGLAHMDLSVMHDNAQAIALYE